MAPAKSRANSSSSRQPKKPSYLKSGRPPLFSTPISTSPKPTATATTKGPSQSHSQSSKHTRHTIRTHHVLQKQLVRAKAANDTAKIQALESQLAESGGLKSYQLASTVGQSASRGGDSSRVLVEWLHDEIEVRKRALKSSDSARSAKSAGGEDGQTGSSPPLNPRLIHILEIGALSTSNALNIPAVTSVRRIDLRSSGPGIEECDFMAFPLPDAIDGSGEWRGRRGYDVLSLSLVLNYVPDAKGRGDMLRRTVAFFASASVNVTSQEGEDEGSANDDSKRGSRQQQLTPSLFLVLPAPCLHNSRYLTPEHLKMILSSLGYTLLQHKTTQKLHYSLWLYDARKRLEWRDSGQATRFRKKEINPGGGRNNFCIILEDSC